jgi:Arc/MetJ-type ribon-helix-helix transcriptional regulator
MLNKILMGLVTAIISFALFQQVQMSKVKADLIVTESAYQAQIIQNEVASQQFRSRTEAINKSALELVEDYQVREAAYKRETEVLQESLTNARVDKEKLATDHSQALRRLNEVVNDEDDECLDTELPVGVNNWLQSLTHESSL